MRTFSLKIHHLFLCRYLPIVGLLLLGSSVCALELKGALSQGGMLLGRVSPGTIVTLMERKITVDNDGTFVFGLGRNAPPEIKLVTSNGKGEEE